jgi:hypothetical protein
MSGDDYEEADFVIDGVSLRDLLPRRRKQGAGPKESQLWDEIVPHLKAAFPGSEPPKAADSFRVVSEWLRQRGKVLAKSTIRKGIKRHFPEWSAEERNRN